MTFTDEDVPLMKLIFNPSTHEMGMLVGGERAEEIFEYVCKEIYKGKILFYSNISHFYYNILCNDIFCEFFLDNSILQISLMNADSIYCTLRYSLIAEKIWDSGKLDLTKLNNNTIWIVLTYTPIAKKIWDSGKLNLSLLSKNDLEYFKQKFES